MKNQRDSRNLKQPKEASDSISSSAGELENRINACAEKVGGKKALAKMAGISESQIHRYVSGESRPGIDPLVAIARAADVRLEWLASGDGVMLRSGMNAEAIKAITAGKKSKGLAPEGFALIPRYNIEASAGPGALTDAENVVDYLAFQEDWVRRALHADPRKLVLITAIGDSMEPTIRSGDLLLVDTGINDFIDDAIYVVGIDDHLVVKRVQSFMGGAITIRSDNSMAYVEQTLSAEEAETIRVAGRVRWIGRLI